MRPSRLLARVMREDARMAFLAARIAAFSDDPLGGNPAGVVVGDELPPDDVMLQIAKDVGYSETAFLAGDGGSEWTARYWSPEAEVPFCGHATIASAIALYRQYGATELLFDTLAGSVPVAIDEIGGVPWATLTSVEPHVDEIAPDVLALLLALLPEFPDQIMLGMDAARRSYWRCYGGAPGLTFLLVDFSTQLHAAGVNETSWRRIFVTTPATTFAFASFPSVTS